MHLRFAALPIICVTSFSLLTSAVMQAQDSSLPAGSAQVFGYTDFTAQAKIDAAFLAVPDAKYSKPGTQDPPPPSPTWRRPKRTTRRRSMWRRSSRPRVLRRRLCPTACC